MNVNSTKPTIVHCPGTPLPEWWIKLDGDVVACLYVKTISPTYATLIAATLGVMMNVHFERYVFEQQATTLY